MVAAVAPIKKTSVIEWIPTVSSATKTSCRKSQLNHANKQEAPTPQQLVLYDPSTS